VARISSDVEQLERFLLRRGLGLLAADRHRCSDCGRTPLEGELVYTYDGSRTVCELCRPQCSKQPLSSEIVRHSELGHTVRLVARAA
jgi:hypothetical protein